MAMSSGAGYLRHMNIGSYFRLEGVLVAGAVNLYVQARNGALWDVGLLKNVAHLLQSNVVVEGIRTGAEAIAVNWIEASEPFQRALSSAA
ncbi:hypothetical protein H5V43_21830 (plasmid) [Sphingobium fuliginis]|jgi:hypothetical protein|uniref:Uncharacterized protein n=1 Tax=Sphingobium fuliginis (strain ATCC 27551) TaxID=336203 RepID=A0A7M2GQ92_SPHSA|nr:MULTISPECIES: DUF5818 domain-containing protein [Sphingobium]QOT74515.1 hypothetical protein H5V43_21830 [Sphingobium fuliginis]